MSRKPQTYPRFEETSEGRMLHEKLARIDAQIEQHKQRVRAAGAELEKARAEQADIYSKIACGEASEQDAENIERRLRALEREVIGDPTRGMGYGAARVNVKREIEAAREAYGRTLVPMLNEQYRSTVESLATALSMAATANAAVDRAQAELRKHGLQSWGLCFPGLTWNCHGETLVHTTRSEFGAWCELARRRGFDGVPDPWREREDVAQDALLQAGGRDANTAALAVNQFRQQHHEPLRAEVAGVLGRVTQTITRLIPRR